ncbi:MAG: hypothetical protein WDA24_09960 [Tissierellales bacterium]
MKRLNSFILYLVMILFLTASFANLVYGTDKETVPIDIIDTESLLLIYILM